MTDESKNKELEKDLDIYQKIGEIKRAAKKTSKKK